MPDSLQKRAGSWSWATDGALIFMLTVWHVVVAAAELLKLENCFHNARRSMLATAKEKNVVSLLSLSLPL